MPCRLSDDGPPAQNRRPHLSQVHQLRFLLAGALLVEGLRARGHDAELLDHHCDEVMTAELRCALQPKLPERSPRQEIRAYAAKVRRFCEPQGHQVSRAALTWSRGRMGNLLDRALPPPER